jgi:2-methylcitrate dehydratase PrpD
MRQAPSISEQLADCIAALDPDRIPAPVRARAEDLLIDVAGLCVAARNRDYVHALIAAVDRGGACTALGHTGAFSAEDAAMINGTAAHGEDFDDTFESGLVHTSVVVVPAVLAACERFGRDGRAALIGTVAGIEALCRLGLVAPMAIHQSGFHPTSVIGAMASTVAVSTALGFDRRQTVDALGIAGSMAGGIIEYLTEGAWTKRLHAGWAARIGLHAARIAQHGFFGPRTVLEGTHGLFNGFARTADRDYDVVTRDFGRTWHMLDLTFKCYATGAINQPFIDCALRLARHGFSAEDVAEVVCEAAEGSLHRLWEPLASKQAPANDYAAKFSAPFNIAVAFVTGAVGLEAFTEKSVRDPRILGLASKVRYVIDRENPYPKALTGHVRMTLKNGDVYEERQPHMRGGVLDPLSRDDLEQKFRGNTSHGGWSEARADEFLRSARSAFDGRLDLSPFRG